MYREAIKIVLIVVEISFEFKHVINPDGFPNWKNSFHSSVWLWESNSKLRRVLDKLEKLSHGEKYKPSGPCSVSKSLVCK